MIPEYKDVSSGEVFRDQFEAAEWKKPRKRDFTFVKQFGDVGVRLSVSYSTFSHTPDNYGGYPYLRLESKRWARVGTGLSERLKEGTIALIRNSIPQCSVMFDGKLKRARYPLAILGSTGEYSEELIRKIIRRCERFCTTYDPQLYFSENMKSFPLPEMQKAMAGVFGILLEDGRVDDAVDCYRRLGEFVTTSSLSIPNNQWTLANGVLQHYGIDPSWSL
jgi:hypothetical protein